ncbi:hypothetical protein NMG60_11028908 [Bertholletia excelsa]
MGSKVSKKARHPPPGLEDSTVLASETPRLYELYKKLCSSVINDEFIQKEELLLALFRNSKKQDLFVDRIFDLFDVKRNGRIEFGEFVRSLSIVHPKTPDTDKIKYAFKLYDLRHIGYIEREEAGFILEETVLALFKESDLILSDDVVETIDKTFAEADSKGDGRIDQEEWKEYMARNPTLLKNMTVPYLMDITLTFPSFVLNTEHDDSGSRGWTLKWHVETLTSYSISSIWRKDSPKTVTSLSMVAHQSLEAWLLRDGSRLTRNSFTVHFNIISRTSLVGI